MFVFTSQKAGQLKNAPWAILGKIDCLVPSQFFTKKVSQNLSNASAYLKTCRRQGCQMLYFQTKNLGKTLEGLAIELV
jgi:hypothetical protein